MAAGNEWLNGYLEAILDAGSKGLVQGGGAGRSSSSEYEDRGGGGDQSKSLVPGLRFSPTRYFVEEVVNSFDEADLHKTWVKVIATRNTRERNNRLENMCWRIWHLARKKKQLETEGARGLAKRRLEREQGRRDASEDISELSEGEMREKGSAGAGDSVKGGSVGSMSRINSDAHMWPLAEEDEEPPPRNLYIVLISVHGLVRGENMELGRDSDTGGQVKYVVELARALAAAKGVRRVDLLTRQISSPEVDWTYGEPVEMLQAPRSTDAGQGAEQGTGGADGGSGAAYIIRLPFGPREKYIPKESLWPYIPEFVDRALAHILDVSRALSDQQQNAGDAIPAQPTLPYVIHGHYADAAEAAARLAGALGVPMALTGHSLGRNKLEQLLKQGRLSRADIHATYRIMRRIEAEELGLDAAEVVVTSTRQEVDEQWGLYDGFDVRLERKLRVRRRRGVSCLGRYMPRMAVIPPGMDFSNVKSEDGEGDLAALLVGRDRRKTLPPIWSEIMRFFSNPHKPMILALSRPDPKKNVTTLIRAFGESRHLRELANMTLILGNRDDVEEMTGGPAVVLTTVLKLIDKYDLYGHVAYPKHHKQSDVPEIYRLAAKTKGVFINPALVEPFGLTLIEAAAYGLPVVATKNGGPVDILKALNNGLLIDPHDHRAFSDALLKLLADKSLWHDCRKNGLKNIHKFSWPEHCRSYLAHVEHSRSRHPSTAALRLPAPPQAAAVASALQSAQEPLTESLRGVDISLRMSLDGTGTNEAASKMQPNGADVAAALLDALRHRRGTISIPNGSHAAPAPPGYGPGRRRQLFVVAADCYGSDGVLDPQCLAGVLSAVSSTAEKTGGSTGLVLSTGMTLSEALAALKTCGYQPARFDALVCSSGAELCFPWKDGAVEPESDYAARVGYRWPGAYVKAAVPRLARQDGEEEDGMAADEAACSSQSYGYLLKPGAKARKVDEIRQRLRMRGFRCNLVYTRGGTRLVVMPLFASRSYALRYLWMTWGINLSKTVVFVGDLGDTDLEELQTGLHKVAVLKGVVRHGTEPLLRGEDNYKREDVIPPACPGDVAVVEEGWGEAEIASAVEELGLKG